MEIAQAHASQKEAYKHRLTTCKSLGKGGSILACNILQRIKEKYRKEADDRLQKARRAIILAENKAKNELYIREVQACKDEKAHIQYIRQLQSQPLGVDINPLIQIPVRDSKKNPTTAKREALRTYQLLYNATTIAQQEQDASQSKNPTDFTSIPIEPSILYHKQQFQLQQAPLSQVVIQVDKEEEEEEGSDIETLPRSVASLDSIAQNTDFIALEYQNLEDNGLYLYTISSLFVVLKNCHFEVYCCSDFPERRYFAFRQHPAFADYREGPLQEDTKALAADYYIVPLFSRVLQRTLSKVI